MIFLKDSRLATYLLSSFFLAFGPFERNSLPVSVRIRSPESTLIKLSSSAASTAGNRSSSSRIRSSATFATSTLPLKSSKTSRRPII